MRRKTNFRGEAKYLPCGGKFIAVRMAVNFCAYERENEM
nr:MAG TPA: hypothetical protein [Bacteriophage sp.]